MTCLAEMSEAVGIVELRGELTIATAVPARMALHKALTDQPTAVVVDLSAMQLGEELSALLFTAFARTAAHWPGCPVLLCTPDPGVRDVLARLAVDRAAPVFADRAAALAAATSAGAPRRFSQRLAGTRAAPAIARRAVATACTAWQLVHLVEDAELIVTELVSNAVLHAGGDLELAVILRDQFLHLSVRDTSREPPRRSRPDPETGEGGRGLALLDAIASGWGSPGLLPGKVVWATLRTYPAQPRRARRHPEP